MSLLRLLCVLAVLVLPVHAQDGTWQKAFLWQVQKDAKQLYLLGGMGVGKEAFYPMPASVGQALRESEVVILEVDPGDDEAARRALQLGLLARGESLDQQLPRDLYEEVYTLALNYDIAEGELRAMRPWMLYFQIIFKEFANAGYRSDYSTEMIVYGLAKGLNKEVGSLESADAAAKYLNTLPPELQQAMLRGLLAEIRDEGVLKNLAALWTTMRRGDEQQFMATVAASEKLYPQAPQLREALFYARHAAMLEKIEGYLASGKKHLVVVGAVNLLGERGLVETLRKKGYEVKPR